MPRTLKKVRNRFETSEWYANPRDSSINGRIRIMATAKVQSLCHDFVPLHLHLNALYAYPCSNARFGVRLFKRRS